jgi:hypothetical protein
MTTQTLTKPAQDQSLEKKIQQFREIFADAPELGKRALENALAELRSQTSDLPPPVESAGRVGARLGKVAEGQPLARREQGRHPAQYALCVLR